MKQQPPQTDEPSLSLHDSLALGEVEVGLMTVKHDRSEMEEIHRLPVLLRLLSSSRPLASVPTFPSVEMSEQESQSQLEGDGATPIDELANQVVARLEDVAATYSIAEGVDVVACHLAPSICRNLSKLPPLKRKRDSITAATTTLSTKTTTAAETTTVSSAINNQAWDISELVLVGANPRTSFKRRRISQTQTVRDTTVDSADELNVEGSTGVLSEGAIMSSDDDENEQKAENSTKGTKPARIVSRRSSEPGDVKAGAVMEDSQEEVVAKTLSDLAALVASALEPIKMMESEDADGNNNASGRRGKLSLRVDDSTTLSEVARGHNSADSVRGVMAGSDLGSTVAALMHHAPVLRHQHVANALCRATIPQTADLVKRMGANCPSAVPSLLRGCMDAYQSAMEQNSRRRHHQPNTNSISNMAKSAILALAELSEREASRVTTVLQQNKIMADVELQIAMKSQDPLSALCLLLQHLSSSVNDEDSTDFVPPISTSSADNVVLYRESLEDSNRMATRVVWCDLPLKKLLQENTQLMGATLTFLQEELSSVIQTNDLSAPFGQLCLILESYTWIVLQCDVATISQSVSDEKENRIASVLSVLQEFTTKISNHSTMNGSSSSKGGRTEKLLSYSFCASILTFAWVLSDDGADKTVLDQSAAFVKQCFACRSNNAKYGVFVTRFACSLFHNDTKACLDLLNPLLVRGLTASDSCILDFAPKLEGGLRKVGKWVEDELDIDGLLKDGISWCSVLDGLSLLDLIKYTPASDSQAATEKVKEFLSELLCKTSALVLLANDKIPEFIVSATGYLAHSVAMNIPIVSPVHLESTSAHVVMNRLKFEKLPTESTEVRFLFQVLYWFAYMDAGVNSLFMFDPRLLPLKEVLSSCRHLSGRFASGTPLSFHVESLIAKHCPEISKQYMRWELLTDSRINYIGRKGHFDRRTMKLKLSQALKFSLSHDSTDWSAIAERVFIVARGQLSDSDLCTQVVSALLTTPNSPPPFSTYSMLCRDPLVLLRAAMRVWQSQSLRRIVLTILSCLLETNEVILEESSPSNIGADELIASRNLLLMRGVLVAVSGSDDINSEHNAHICSMVTHFMRRLIADSRGLVGLLVKQSPALPDTSLDWLVEFVPETMDDVESLVNVFSERGSPTTRLTAASAILRIAIAHGHRDEAVTERIVYAALTQLISSFFLVIGPVGVPVNVLVGDGTGLDVTQTSRKATFRMLRSLVNVRGRQRPRLRNECGMALHKLAGLCKGENILTGVAGAVASRRKALLREIFDSVSKAANAMGSGIEL